MFGGQFGIQVPTSGWMDTHAVEKNGLSVDGNELFVSEKALLGPGFAIISIRYRTSFFFLFVLLFLLPLLPLLDILMLL